MYVSTLFSQLPASHPHVSSLIWSVDWLSDPPVYLPFLFPHHFPKSEPHSSCGSSFLTGSLSPLFSSCSAEMGREQSREDRGHMDTQGMKNEQTGRKVTLIEVRGNPRESHITESTGEDLGKAWLTVTNAKESK